MSAWLIPQGVRLKVGEDLALAVGGARLCLEEHSDEKPAAAGSIHAVRSGVRTCCGWSSTQPRSAQGTASPTHF